MNAQVREPAWFLIAMCWALFGLASLTHPGCGSVSPEVRLSYADEVVRCREAEQAIVARQGTTEAEDLAALAAVREECDRHFREIEATP